MKPYLQERSILILDNGVICKNGALHEGAEAQNILFVVIERCQPNCFTGTMLLFLKHEPHQL